MTTYDYNPARKFLERLWFLNFDDWRKRALFTDDLAQEIPDAESLDISGAGIVYPSPQPRYAIPSFRVEYGGHIEINANNDGYCLTIGSFTESMSDLRSLEIILYDHLVKEYLGHELDFSLIDTGGGCLALSSVVDINNETHQILVTDQNGYDTNFAEFGFIIGVYRDPSLPQNGEFDLPIKTFRFDKSDTASAIKKLKNLMEGK